MEKIKILLFGITFCISIVFATLYWQANTLKDITLTPETKQNFDKTQHSLTNPKSIWVVVNKEYSLPVGYEPENLVQPNVSLNPLKNATENSISIQIAPSLKNLLDDAKTNGYDLFLASGYRSEDLQTVYFNNYVALDGLEAANRYSAKPGQSEHQTGFAVDIARTDRNCYIEVCFGSTPDGKWIAKNAHRYGFVVRYPKDKTSSTGYQYEPWHLRYVGSDLATELYRSGKTLEEYFNKN